MEKRTWAEIDLDAIAHNIRGIRRITSPSARVMAVVKADAYGHGVIEVTKTALENGADCLAVATLGEAKQLRRAGITAPILILGALSDDTAAEIAEYDITPAVFSYDFAAALSNEAQKQGKTVKIHIKIDTGMGRIGYLAESAETAEEILKIAALKNIEIEGIFSHFATSDEKDTSYTHMQYERFMGLINRLEENNLHIPVKHICNSAGIMMYPEMHLDMVRAGIILYGLYPSDEVDKTRLDLIPAMTLKSVITHVKELGAGEGVSYGRDYITSGTTRIATVPIGYADGYIRRLAQGGHMLVNGEKVPIIGRICMDQCMIDVTNVHNINKGDEVTVFGREGITADDIAMQLGTINYEVSCMASRRVPRVYKKNGRTVKVSDYLD